MSGRARTQARGQRRSLSPGQVGPLRAKSPEGTPSPADLRQQDAEVPPAVDAPGTPGMVQSGAAAHGLAASAGGRKLGRHCMDLAVCTREKLAHVRDSKEGHSGVPVQLVANLFNLDLPQDWQLYQYHVMFHPDIESRRLRTALLCGHSELSGKAKAFDGATLFLLEALEEKVTELSGVTQRDQTVQMTVTLTRQLPASSPVCMQVFSLIFWKVLKKLSLHRIGRNFYNPSQPMEIHQHKLSLWPGFAISVSQFEKRLLFHADVSYKVLRNETVLEFMVDLCNRDTGLSFTETCEKQLIGLVVLTRYNNKTYRVDDIDWSVKPIHTFRKRDGTCVTYVEYYKQQYNITVSDLGQPMLVSLLKSKRNDNAETRLVHLLPELCFLTGLSSQARSDFQLMKAVTEETRLSPLERQQRLSQFVDAIQRNKDARFELETWGLQVGAQLSVTGRVVPAEKIFLQDHVCQPESAANWSRDMQMCKILSAMPLNNWMLLYCDRMESATQYFLSCLTRAGGSLGFSISHPKIISVQENSAAFVKAIQRYFDPNVQLVMCVLPSNQKGYYDAIKKFLSSDCPVPSQCVLSRTLHRPGIMRSVATKVALQMACKLGGELWAVEIPLKSLMVVGIDICRDTFSSGMMVVGFVASTNPGITRWYSRCILQKSTTAVADNLKIFMSGALNKWYKFNHTLPGRIIVYREGVGDGELQALVEYEVPQLLSSITASSPHSSPKLSVVVVRRRCALRFLAEMNHTVQNPPPGTVVDSEATRPGWYDFYLVSQTAGRGTVSPTYYNIIYDDNGLKPDHMQRLTFKLCHVYYNWQGLIRTPAPCQYATKLTFLVAQSIHKEPSLQLSNTLFYL